MYRYVLFDLDGTLTDPKEGICKSVQYALHAQNIEETNLDRLEPFIGPPLNQSFREFYGMDEEQSKEAVSKFRERFETVGIYENELYPGMKEFLTGLQKKGIHLAIASSKPKEFVEKVLRHFEIRRYFEVVVGSEKDGRKVEKIDVMREALSRMFSVPEEHIQSLSSAEIGKNDLSSAEIGKDSSPSETLQEQIPWGDILMVGDRKFDVLGAKAFSIRCAAVSYGYAPEGELEEAGADYITDNLEELWEIITGESWRKKQTGISPLKKSVRILAPLVYDYVLTIVIVFMLGLGLQALVGGPLQGNDWFETHSEMTSVIFQGIAACVESCLFIRIYQKEKCRPISHVVKRRNDRKLIRQGLPLAGASICVALFLNIVFTGLRIFALSASYEEVTGIQYSVPLVVGLVIYGVLVPIEEEIVFRGLIYGRMRQYFPIAVSVPVSALLFGAYHGNLVQFLYAFLMGCLLAWAYERYKSLKASILVHSAANLAAYTVSSISVLQQSVFTVKGCLFSGLLAGLLLGCLFYDGNIKVKSHIQQKTHR